MNKYGINLISDMLFDTFTTKVSDQAVDQLKETVTKLANKSHHMKEAHELLGQLFLEALESAHSYNHTGERLEPTRNPVQPEDYKTKSAAQKALFALGYTELVDGFGESGDNGVGSRLYYSKPDGSGSASVSKIFAGLWKISVLA